jgi:uncharacterized membrane protein YhfC
MTPTFQMSPGRIGFSLLAIALEIALPLVLALWARRRLGVGWRYFGYGALIFFLFQVISRVPLVTIAGAMLVPTLADNPGAQLAWGAGLALTAGLFEEVGRYIGYRWLMRREEKTWRKAIMYGLGHGGLESMLLIAGLALLSLLSLLALSATGLDQIPAAQRDAVAAQLADLSATPDWLALVAVWERAWALAFHVAMSVLVVQVFRRGGLHWLGLAIVLHALLDFAGPLVSLLGLDSLSAIVVNEAVVAGFGIAGLAVIRAFREPPSADERPEGPPLPPPLEAEAPQTAGQPGLG